MILHDRVAITQRIETGAYDDYGLPIVADVETWFPAEVRPLSSSETVTAGSQVQTRYRVFLPHAAESLVSSGGALTWREKKYEIEGDPEPHTMRGRLHHIELIAHRVTG